LEEMSYSAEQLHYAAELAGTELPGLATEEGLLAELVENVVFEETGAVPSRSTNASFERQWATRPEGSHKP
jgi:hypothetical protein